MSRILVVGTATLDLVFGLDRHPGADEEMRAYSLRTCRGGNAANTAVVLARLGHAPEFLGVLADAPESSVIERDFFARGVTFGHCPRLSGRAPTSSIYLSGAARSIVHYRDLPELDAGHFTALDLAEYDWLHFEGRNPSVLSHMLGYARRHFPALPVSLELEKPRAGIESLFGLADVLFCSRGFAHHCGFDDPEAFLSWMLQQAPGATITVAWGEHGAFGVAANEAVCHVAAMPLSRTVDTLGAGDTFNAGMLDACMRGLRLSDALAGACRLAEKKCAAQGFDF